MSLNKSLKCGGLLLTATLPFNLFAQSLFDAHLHYSAEDAKHFSPKAILQELDINNIPKAVVTGTPATHVNDLYRLSPRRIVPLLGIYRTHEDKQTWTGNEAVINYVEKELERGYWRGIGELHIFAKDRRSPVFKKIVALAAERKLPLLLHADPAVIDTLYEIAPGQPVIWAHAGTYPYPDLVSDYLQRYSALAIDVSMRDERIAPNGIIDDGWYELFITYPDRVMVGVDTYSTTRWHELKRATEKIRHWLAQLPPEVAKKLAFTNAARIYKCNNFSLVPVIIVSGVATGNPITPKLVTPLEHCFLPQE